MSNKSTVKICMVGVGNMGASHARQLLSGAIPHAELSAVCDEDAGRLEAFPEIPGFIDYREALKSASFDAIVIATPHYAHTPISIAAIQASLHVLVEKPLGVHKADCERTIAAFEARRRKDLVFAVMFNQRTKPVYQKLKRLISTGELGKIQRVNWTITDWFRSERYYASGGWRATWKGEGGGVLLNQCPHQLDLMQWLFGMPVRVRAFGAFGKYHNIEVEDEITAYLEYDNGCTGVFIASTGEAPGTNRLEIAAERGRVVVEDGAISWLRNEIPTPEFSATTQAKFGKPPYWEVRVPIAEAPEQEHVAVLTAFVSSILGTGELVAHGSEGIQSVELGNSMLLSALKERTVTLPLDAGEFEQALGKLITSSRADKKVVDSGPATVDEMNASF